MRKVNHRSITPGSLAAWVPGRAPFTMPPDGVAMVTKQWVPKTRVVVMVISMIALGCIVLTSNQNVWWCPLSSLDEL